MKPGSPIPLALAAATLLATSSAAAQRAPDGACVVSIARAPDDVRTVIETWVRAEPRCTVALEVRVVPTEGGLYLLARDEYGRLRERVVPDAQSAGVLVASWMAADSMRPTSPYDVRRPARLSASIESEPARIEVAAPPGQTPVVVEQAATATASRKWLTLGGMFAMSGTGGGGVRGELDVKTRGMGSLGLGASASQSGMMVHGTYGGEMGLLETFDAKLIAYAGLTAELGRWHLRSAIGAGAVYTAATLRQFSSSGYRQADGVFPTGEAAIIVGRSLGRNWALYAGPVVTLFIQQYEVSNSDSSYDDLRRRDLEAMMMIGVRHRL